MQLSGGFAHLRRHSVCDVHTIHYAHHRRLDCHLLIANCRARCFAKSANHHLAGAGAQPIRDHHDVSRRFLFQDRMGEQPETECLQDQAISWWTKLCRLLCLETWFRVVELVEFRVSSDDLSSVLGSALCLTRTTDTRNSTLFYPFANTSAGSAMSRAAGVIIVFALM